MRLELERRRSARGPLHPRPPSAVCTPVVVGALVGLWSEAAFAQTRTQVDIAVCSAQANAKAFESALAIELSASNAEIISTASTAEPSDARRLSIARCSLDDGVLEVTLSTNAAATPEQRTLDLRDVPEPARARVAAIAIAEMVRAWPPPSVEWRTAPETTPPAKPTVSQEAPPARVPEAARTLALALAARAVAIGTEPLLLYGADLAVSHLTLPWLRTGIAANYQNGSFSGEIGTANLDVFGAELSLALPLSQRGNAELGPFIGGAYLRAKAESALDLSEDPDTAWTSTAGLRAHWHSDLGSSLGLVSSLALGHTLRGAVFRAGNEPAFGYQGVLVEVRLGLAFAQ